MKEWMILMAVLIFHLGTSAQNDSPPPIYTDEDLRNLSNLTPFGPGAKIMDLRYEGIKGTPFLFEDWKPGYFKLKNKDDFGKKVPVNLNLQDQVLYFTLDGGYVGSLPTNLVEALKIELSEESTPLIYKVRLSSEVEGEKEMTLRFYQVIYEGEKYTLYKAGKKFIRKADYQGAYSADRRYDEYLLEDTYWLRTGDDPFQKVKPKKKAFEQAIPAEEADLFARLSKSERIDFKADDDLARLLREMEAIQ